MKKTIRLLLAVVLAAALSSCGGSGHGSADGGKTVNGVIAEKTGESAVSTSTAEPASVPSESTAADPFAGAKGGDVDVDLTKLSATMTYAQVNDMLMYPKNYTGKTVRMKGAFAVYEGEDRNYFAVIIEDATACCQQGIEFILADDLDYPSEYPEKGTEIEVVGTYHTYPEGQISYPELYDATMTVKK
ncbi:MAG: hypothetical protein IJS78_04470 [Clostridia bacterium]|nr:hypothetical protein [Clostridia bacterium]